MILDYFTSNIHSPNQEIIIFTLFLFIPIAVPFLLCFFCVCSPCYLSFLSCSLAFYPWIIVLVLVIFIWSILTPNRFKSCPSLTAPCYADPVHILQAWRSLTSTFACFTHFYFWLLFLQRYGNHFLPCLIPAICVRHLFSGTYYLANNMTFLLFFLLLAFLPRKL